MGSTHSDANLAWLRAKRDRELVAIIESTLESGINALRQGEGTGEEPRAHAERAHSEAMKLLRLLNYVSPLERRRLDARLEELRFALGDTTYLQERRVRTAGC